MATETVKRCDIYDSKSDVRTFDIKVEEIIADGGPEHSPTFYKSMDLSPRALERLIGFINRGTSKPAKKEEPSTAKA